MAKHDPFVEDPFDDDDSIEEELEDEAEESDDDESDAPVAALHSPRRRARDAVIIHADDAIVIVDKSAGVALRADENGRAVLHDVVEDADYDLPGAAYVVHPADAEASGLVVLARTERVRDQLCSDIASGRLDLCCQALVQAVMPAESGTITADIKVTDDARGRVRIDSTGRPATTLWRTLDTFVNYALLECRPRSAERCQIRAHLQHAGMPLAVDKIYGGAQHLMLSSFKAGYRRSRRRPEKPLIERLSLHAASLSMVHPTTGETLKFDAPPPRDFKAAVHQLGRFGRIPKSSVIPKSGR